SRSRWRPPERDGRRGRASGRLQHAALDLVALERLEQGLEVAFAEALVTLALDELEEHRPEHRLREDLQQQALLAALCAAVEEDAARLQRRRVLAVAGDALVEHAVVGARR